jgi:hypothetical protein
VGQGRAAETTVFGTKMKAELLGHDQDIKSFFGFLPKSDRLTRNQCSDTKQSKMNLSFASLLHTFVSAVSLTLVSAHSIQAESHQMLRIALLDGEEISYAGDPQRPNYVVLEELIPRILSGVSVSTQYFDVGTQKADETWIDAEDILAFKPDLVLMHWSAFRPPEGEEHCVTDGSAKRRGCAQEIVDLLSSVLAGSENLVSFVIYSRSSTLCTNGRRSGLINLMNDNDPLSEQVGLMAMTSIARGTEFGTRRVQRDMKALILHMSGIESRGFDAADINGGLCLLKG